MLPPPIASLLLLRASNKFNSGLLHFEYENMLLNKSDIHTSVDGWHNNLVLYGWVGHVLMMKLKASI